MTGDVEEAILEMYLSGISVRKIAGVTDAMSRIASRLEEEQKKNWREQYLKKRLTLASTWTPPT